MQLSHFSPSRTVLSCHYHWFKQFLWILSIYYQTFKMRQVKPKVEKDTKDKPGKEKEPESESSAASSSDEDADEDNATEGDEEKDSDDDDGSKKSSDSDGDDDNDSSSDNGDEDGDNDTSSDQEGDNKTDKSDHDDGNLSDSEANSDSDDFASSKMDNDQDDLRSVVSGRSLDAGTLTVEGSTLVESRPPSVASVPNHPDIIVREATADVEGNKAMPSHTRGANYHREARGSGSTMSEEPDPDFPAQVPQTRRGSLFDIPTGPRRPTITGASVTSSNIPHEDEAPSVFKPPKKFENTYKLEPERRFISGKARIIIEEILEQQLEDQIYDPIACSILSQDLSTLIKDKVKSLGYNRYKFIAMVTIGEKKEQGIRMGSRAIWDIDRDTSASVTYENPNIFAVANLFALYFE